MRLNPESIARASSRHPWRTVIIWVLLLVAMGLVTQRLLDGVLTQDIEFTNRPQSVQVQEALDAAFPDRSGAEDSLFVLAQGAPGAADDPAFQAAIASLTEEIRALGDDVVGGPVSSYLDIRGQGQALLLPDGAAAIAVQLASPDGAVLADIGAAATAAAPSDATVEVLTPIEFAARAQQTTPPPAGTDIPEAFVVVSVPEPGASADALPSATQAIATAVADAAGDALASPPVTPYAVLVAAEGTISQDRSTVLIPVQPADTDEATLERFRELAHDATTEDLTVEVAGRPLIFVDFAKVSEEDLRRGEAFGLGIALVVLIAVFAAVVAAIVPIVMGLFAIGIALGAVALLGQFLEFNLFVTNMVSMIGLAVGIDYSLFIVSRYREERRRGREKLEAIGMAGATANRAVFFSGVTVVLALLGMLFVPSTIFQSLGVGAVTVTIFAIGASMTLLPAILAILGDRVNWPALSKRARVDADHDPKGGFWDRITNRVMARPVVFLLVAIAILGGLGSQYFQLNRGTSQNITTLPDEFESKAAFVLLAEQFSGGTTQPIEIVLRGEEVEGPAFGEAVAAVQARIAEHPQLADASRVDAAPSSGIVLVQAYLNGDPATDAAFQTVRDLREELPGVVGDRAEVLVGGETAYFTDFLAIADDAQVPVFAFVLGLSFILLTVVFRSIVLPIKAILMNLLSVGAAYGAVTLVFQEGVGIGFFNAIGFQFRQVEAIEAWLPLFLFSILFGLSMDYHVFMLTRIREEFDRTRDNAESVAYGLRTTAGIITGAALIMVAVFTAFASGRLGPLQQMGFGLAVAIFLDATIVRSILVPASMRLLGDRNWYLPRWLRWLPELHVEGPASERVR
ncbi:MAG: MMPL family transporter [Actinomycetota bacterium]